MLFDRGYLADRVLDNEVDTSFRPNQIFAISLPFPLVSLSQAESILRVLEEKLATPVGLRSLEPGHPAYRPYYRGDSWLRDTAYHQGTVWSWLLGPYCSALLRFRGEAGKQQAQALFRNLEGIISSYGVGSIAEIYDAESPHTPRGCPFQAWGVAEILRAYLEINSSDFVQVPYPKISVEKVTQL